ncbi:MAG: methyltransferase domain-containing protein [Alphaproteobacteria bacterium]
MSPEAAKSATPIAEEYYDSADADAFYREIWGGEDIHIGLYGSGESISEASHKTVLKMASRVKALSNNARVLDIGAGYGGAARVVAKKFGAHVVCLNLSAVENARNAKLNEEQGLSDNISIRHGTFEDIPEPSQSIDVVWSQDAILHSGNRERVLEEVARVLKPGGDFIFTDPMQADELSDLSVLQPIYDRIHLQNLGSFAFYRRELTRLGFEEVQIEDLSQQLFMHYTSVARDLKEKRASLEGKVSSAYVDRMLNGLDNWIEGGKNGYLTWGIMHFTKT